MKRVLHEAKLGLTFVFSFVKDGGYCSGEVPWSRFAYFDGKWITPLQIQHRPRDGRTICGVVSSGV
jgi:hypothetical protein